MIGLFLSRVWLSEPGCCESDYGDAIEFPVSEEPDIGCFKNRAGLKSSDTDN